MRVVCVMLLRITRILLSRYGKRLNQGNILVICWLLFLDFDLRRCTLLGIIFLSLFLSRWWSFNFDLLKYGVWVGYRYTLLLWLNLLRGLFLLNFLLNNRIFLLWLGRRCFEVKFLRCNFFKRSHCFSCLAILWKCLVVSSEFQNWIYQFSLHMLLRRNAEHHIGIVRFKAAIIERRKRQFRCLLILLVMPRGKHIAMLVIVCVVKVWVLEEIHAFHQTVLIISKQMRKIVARNLFNIKRRLLFKCWGLR